MKKPPGLNQIQLTPILPNDLELIDCMGDDTTVTNAARVSYKGFTDLNYDAEKTQKLIRYLLKNKHTSPFEHVKFTFRVNAPIFVARQWMRHRTGSFNEISARYSPLPGRFYLPPKLRAQSTDNKQMSGPGEVDQGLLDIIRLAYEQNYDDYVFLLHAGVAREQARAILPTGIFTSFYWSVDLHNLLKFLDLRLHPHAQPEIQVYAQVLANIAMDKVPFTMNEWATLRHETV